MSKIICSHLASGTMAAEVVTAAASAGEAVGTGKSAAEEASLKAMT